MKLIHLSDLHIGKRVNELSMIDDQKFILLQILRIVEDEQPDGVLIAGDIYDKSIPSAEAVTLFDEFLCRLAELEVPVLMVSGNHDSPERLAFGNRLLESRGIYISSVYSGTTPSVTLSDDHGEVVFWLLPFVKPAHVRPFFPQEDIRSFNDALGVIVKHMEVDTSRRNVLLTHQFVTGAATCDSEELSVGGTDNVDAAVFQDFDYVALGHIHGPQNIGSNRIRYCGTPLKYSFSEEHHHKSVTIVHLGKKGDLTLRLRPLMPRHELRSLRGTFEALMDGASQEGAATHDYLHIILTDEEDVPEAVGRLRGVYPNMMKLSYDNTRTRTDQYIDAALEVRNREPVDLLEELYQLQNNQPMSPEQRAFAQELIESLREECL